jgi:hypothetical protein
MAGELAAALAKVQAELPRIAKGEKANVGQYSYEYADLTAVSAAIMPLLGGNGLAFTARPTLSDGRFVLAYSLLHSSGERLDGEYPLPEKGTPQQLGGHITYARRYCLCAVTGVAPGGEDNDAAGAGEVQMDRVKTAWTQPEHARLTQPSPDERVNGRQAERRRTRDDDDPWAGELPEDKPGSIDANQRSGIMASLGGLGIKDRQKRLDLLSEIVGQPVESTNDLSINQAAAVLAELRDRKAKAGAAK